MVKKGFFILLGILFGFSITLPDSRAEDNCRVFLSVDSLNFKVQVKVNGESVIDIKKKGEIRTGLGFKCGENIIEMEYEALSDVEHNILDMKVLQQVSFNQKTGESGEKKLLKWKWSSREKKKGNKTFTVVAKKFPLIIK